MENPEMHKNLKRDPCFDFVRCFALFCVISVHFLLNNGFYNEPVVSKNMVIMTFLRSAFMVCVPLFIILTGCLMKNKKLSKKYYKGILKTISIYVMAGIACELFRILYFHEAFPVKKMILGILGFFGDPYSWYVEMYIGLFLIIPFLNLVYSGLGSKREKQILIATCIFLTALPGVMNVFYLSSIFGKDMTGMKQLIPSWWMDFYPVTYYFIGCYLMEYRPKMKKLPNVILFLFSVLVSGAVNLWKSSGEAFIKGNWCKWGSLLIVIPSVLVFIFFLNLDYSRVTEKKRRFVAILSDCCFGAYLISYIFDSLFYSVLNGNVALVDNRLKYYIIIVPAVFICSLAASYVMNLIYRGAYALLSTKRKSVSVS